MKKFVNILLGCFFVLGVSKGTAADLDEVICNAMKGMQVQEEKKMSFLYFLILILFKCNQVTISRELNELPIWPEPEFAII